MTPTRMAPLDSVVEIVGGGTPSRAVASYYIGSIPWVTSKDMKSFDLTQSQEHISEQALRESATKLIQPGAVLIVVRSGILRHQLPVAVARVPLAINQDLKALICGPEVFPDYLARFLKASTSRILGWVRATTAENFPVARLRRLEVPLPPIEEQRRIATVLARVDDIRRKHALAADTSQALLQSLAGKIFG